MDDSESEEQKHAVGDILAPVRLIEIASDTDAFEEWLREEHDVQTSDEILRGYRFFIETAIRSFLNRIIYNTSPLIEHDFVLYRARFDGIELAKIPDTCEKTAFIKNVNDYRRRIPKISTWEEAQSTLDEFSREVLQPFNELFQEYTTADVNVDSHEALRILSIYHIYIYFNDIRDGYPHGYHLSILEPNLRDERIDEALTGYTYTLQFVWSQLVDSDLYESTSLSDLHTSEKWHHATALDEEIPDDRVDLDQFFGDIKEQIILPLEDETGVDVIEDVLFLQGDTPDDILNELISRNEATVLNTRDEFDYQLLWYPVEFLQASNIFNGVSAFISLLSGTVDLKQRFAEGEEAYVCKFTHPVDRGNDYTYGVLVEAGSTSGMADYSGWVMFYDCCGDYSGFAGSEHAQAEQIIEEYLERGQIELREMELEKDEFQEMVSDKAIGERGAQLHQELSSESERARLKGKIQKARGLLVELISHYYLARTEDELEDLDWNVSLDSGELDITVETSRGIRFIECKFDPENQDWGQEFEKLEEKMEDVDSEKSKQGEFWFWASPPPKTTSRLEQRGFKYRVVSEIVRHAPEFRDKDLAHLQFVMEKFDKDEEVADEHVFEI